jgi:hypothetical protein
MMCRFEVNNYSIISHNLLCMLLTSYFNESNLDWNILFIFDTGYINTVNHLFDSLSFPPKLSTLNFCDTDLCFNYFSKAFKSLKVTYHISLDITSLLFLNLEIGLGKISREVLLTFESDK